jgi:shikimate kinase
MHTVLIGLRGSGKTTIARLLAAATGQRVIDLDERVLASFRKFSVSEVWNEHGENAWREAEVEQLARALRTKDSAVIALGGGVAMIPAAGELLARARESSRVRIIYLRATVDLLIDRLQSAPGDRPSLTDQPWQDEIRTLHAQRDPVYAALADDILEVCDEAPKDTLGRLQRLIAQRRRS